MTQACGQELIIPLFKYILSHTLGGKKAGIHQTVTQIQLSPNTDFVKVLSVIISVNPYVPLYEIIEPLFRIIYYFSGIQRKTNFSVFFLLGYCWSNHSKSASGQPSACAGL